MHAVEMPEHLQDMLEDIRCEIFDKQEEQGFLTDFDIEEIWSKKKQSNEKTRLHRIWSSDMLGFPIDEAEDSRRSFVKKRLKVLSILVRISWKSWNTFWTMDAADDKLPLCEANLEFMKNPYRSDFREQQWWFVPPIIREVQKIRKQPPRTRLPFIKHATKSIGHGMSGDVFRENIAIGHYCNSSGIPNTVSTCCLRFLMWH